MKRIISLITAILLLTLVYLGAGYIHSHLMEKLKNMSSKSK